MRVLVVSVITSSPRMTVFVTVSTPSLGFVFGSAERIIVVVPPFDVVITTLINVPVPVTIFYSFNFPYGLILNPAIRPFRLTKVFISVWAIQTPPSKQSTTSLFLTDSLFPPTQGISLFSAEDCSPQLLPRELPWESKMMGFRDWRKRESLLWVCFCSFCLPLSSPFLLFCHGSRPIWHSNQDSKLLQTRHVSFCLLTLRLNILSHVIKMILIPFQHLRRSRCRHRILERELQAGGSLATPVSGLL
ncbi:hypothetical protein NA56DRAFT_476146 [Hyaloscypha hepaticicola]|uniref:Uncharacterized protein n=1 Tax=Hyaloscypha hepaticicola TaxID=2082293 RepID=A0A2J6PF95_9HELO|nr:hypothetical protein NA56DRAFT_476146 [Hyaloscypha hepaticicola]